MNERDVEMGQKIMNWYKVTFSEFDIGLGKAPSMIESFSAIFAAHGARHDAGLFKDRCSAYVYYFSPGAAQIALGLIVRYAGMACLAPTRSEVEIVAAEKLCSKRLRLASDYNTYTAQYSRAVNVLNQRMGVVSEQGYGELSQTTEVSRALSEKARLDLEKHVGDMAARAAYARPIDYRRDNSRALGSGRRSLVRLP